MCAWAKHTHSTTISIDQFTIIKWKIDVQYTSALSRGKTQKKSTRTKNTETLTEVEGTEKGKIGFATLVIKQMKGKGQVLLTLHKLTREEWQKNQK